MSSMGYIMMNWSSELMMQVKNKRQGMKKRRRDDDSEQEVERMARSRAEVERREIDELDGEFH